MKRRFSYHLAETHTNPMISIFTFILAWAVYAGVFFAAAQSLSPFHSDYREATLSVGFLIGFFNVMLVRVARWLRFNVNMMVFGMIAFALDWILIKGTGSGNFEGNYYVSGNWAPPVVALLLAVTLVIFETLKKKALIDA